MASSSALAGTRTVQGQIDKDRTRWWGVYTIVMVFTLLIGLIAYSSAPSGYAIAFAIMVLASVAAFLRPTIGVYLIVFLTLIGDGGITPWWPFTKNLSSRESVLFTNDSLVISPIEILLGVTLAAWLLRSLADPVWRFWKGGLFRPLVVFTIFVVFGFMRGIAAGGDRRIAIFEARPLFFLPLVYFMVTNLLVTRGQYRRLILMAMLAVSIQSIFALLYYRGLSAQERASLESLSEHSATIHMGAMFVFLLATYLLKCSASLRWYATILIVPVFWAFALSQRRAAMVALFIGIVMLVVVIFYRRRRAFWFFVPAAAFIAVGYIAATWNQQGAVGLPANAVKTVLFPEELAEADRSSDLYRQIEAFDLWFTIHLDPIRGVGFGQKFLQPVQLPDISFFEFWEYLPHNSILWVWLKMGFFGLVATFFLFGRALQLGARSVLAVRSSEHAALVVVGLTYSVMFLVFAYVDIAWNVRSTVFLAVAFALCADFVRAEETVPNVERDRAFELVPQ